MILEKLKQELRDLVAKDCSKEALQMLLQIYGVEKEKNKNINEITTTYLKFAEWNTLQKEIDDNTIYREDREVKYSRINKTILNLIERIDEETAALYELSSSIFTKIVIVCREESRLEEAGRIFSQRYYPNAERPVLAKDFFFNKDEEVKLIIYDDFPRGGDSGEINSTLRKILDKTKGSGTHVLAFSPDRIIELQNSEYINHTYSSNSKFSVHSRIQEMLLYLKYYNFPQNEEQK
jgi:hypothetical protein